MPFPSPSGGELGWGLQDTSKVFKPPSQPSPKGGRSEYLDSRLRGNDKNIKNHSYSGRFYGLNIIKHP